MSPNPRVFETKRFTEFFKCAKISQDAAIACKYWEVASYCGDTAQYDAIRASPEGKV